MLAKARSIDFSQYKKPTVQRRILRRMGIHQIENLDDYAIYLADHSTEIDALYEDILIKVTEFFRAPESFTALKTQVFAKILQQQNSQKSLRIWVPGCATGEEAYSLTICLLEGLEEITSFVKIELFATDISESALAIARRGYYEESRMQNVSPERRRRFFIKDGLGYRVSPIVREPCVFAKQNLVRDPPFSKLDLISCRNLLIYMTPTLQERALASFHFALNDGGFLALGHAESVGPYSDLFEMTDKIGKIFTRKNAVKGHKSLTFSTDGMLAPHNQLNATANRPKKLPTQSDSQIGTQIDGRIDVRNDNRIEPRSDINTDCERAILAKFAESGVIINDRMEVIQFRGDTSPYLVHPPGELTADVFKMCRNGLLIDLRMAVQEAQARNEPIAKTACIKSKSQNFRTVNIDVIPFISSNKSQRHFAVLFVPGINPSSKTESTNPLEASEMQRVERELKNTKEYLNAIIEREQSANEELKSASEEILSANEELQSTNEELATAKEEVQATNEELTTVNEELQGRFHELNRVNNDLTNLFDATNSPIIMVSDKLVIRRFTQASEKILNLVDADIGRSLRDISGKLKIKGLVDLTSTVIGNLNTVEREVEDDSGIWYSLRIKPYRTVDNRIDGAVISLTDISKSKRIAEKATGAKDAAVAANQAKSDFLANMSHEIRTPLSAILGYSELLSDPNQTKSDAVQCTNRIQKNIETLTELIDEILDLSKIEAGKLDIERVRCPLLPALSEILLPLQDRAKAKGLTFSVVFESPIPESILTSTMRLRQILLNVVGNAIKFTDKGRIEIRIRFGEAEPASNVKYLCFAVCDTGCGLSLEQQERLFKPFSQADSSVTRRYGGTGLGLTLARRLAEGLGGSVVLTESTPDVGSCFTFYLDPGALSDVAMISGLTFADLKPRHEAISEVVTATQRLNGLRILLVEDGPDNQILMTHILQANGAMVTHAFNGAEALKLANDDEFDLVLMDMQMPVLDGYEATRRLIASGFKTPIVALTANAMQGERATCLEAGCVEYISKPVKANSLVTAVMQFSKKKTTESIMESELKNDPVVGPIVGQFVKLLPIRVAALKDAQSRSEFTTISSIAHQLAGSSGSYGFPAIGALAAQIETQARQPENTSLLATSISIFQTMCEAAVRGNDK